MTLFDVPAAGNGGGVASAAGRADATTADPGPPPIRMTVAYDGTDFRGFAQIGARAAPRPLGLAPASPSTRLAASSLFQSCLSAHAMQTTARYSSSFRS